MRYWQSASTSSASSAWRHATTHVRGSAPSATPPSEQTTSTAFTSAEGAAFTGEEKKGSTRKAVVQILPGARLTIMNMYPPSLLLTRLHECDTSGWFQPRRPQWRSEPNALMFFCLFFFKEWLNSSSPIQYPLLYCVLSDTEAERMEGMWSCQFASHTALSVRARLRACVCVCVCVRACVRLKYDLFHKPEYND